MKIVVTQILASGAGGGAQSPEDRTREARERYLRGMEAYRARNLRDAIR